MRVSRLRIEVRDKSKVNKGQLKALGAGVLEVGNSVQGRYMGHVQKLSKPRWQKSVTVRFRLRFPQLKPVVHQEPAKPQEHAHTPIMPVAPVEISIPEEAGKQLLCLYW